MRGEARQKNNRISDFARKAIIQKELIIMSVPIMVYLIIFYYLPIWGWLMAFQDYKPGMGIKGSEWVGLKHFEILFGNKEFLQIIRNTICINLLKLIFSTFAAIMLALLLNEARNMRIKRSVQTISYLPHFISWIVIANLVSMSLSTDGGIINIALVNLGLVKSPVLWLGKPEYFWMILALTETWKEMGWSAIIYIAAMTSISPEIYEAANIDGASRIQKIMKITLPSIAPTIAIMLVLSSGWMMTAGFEQVLLMKNPLVIDVAEILPTYILKYGYNMGNFSFATAAGIFQSVVSLIILTIVNVLAKKYNSNYSII